MRKTTTDKWKEILVDPGVFDLKKDYKFKWEGNINIRDFLDSLPDNHFFSCDLPSDMNLKYKKYFLEKSWQYSKAYCYHPQFIVTVQFYHNDYWSFKENFDKYNNLNIKSGFLGIGNYCKQHFYNDFTKHSLPYIFKNSKWPRLHIYGLSMRLIPIAYKFAKKCNIELSIDSTKWTRPINEYIRTLWSGQWFTHKYRQEFFDEYLKEIEKKGVILE